MPFDEESWSIDIASAPDTTPAGEFFVENVVDSDFFSTPVTSYAPTSPLPAGSYWWSVTTATKKGFELRRSAPAHFTIRPRLRVKRTRVAKERLFPSVEVAVTWRANTPNARVTVRVRTRKGRPVWAKRSRERFFTLNEPQTTSFTWYPRSRQEGKRYVLQVIVKAGGRTVTKQRPLRAPKSSF